MRNQILQGDVLEMLETLSAESINCIITSPPYFGLRDYGLPPTHWPAVSYAPMVGLPEITIPPMVCCFGLEDTIEAYVGHMVLVWRGLWRALRGDGVGFLNLGDSYAGSNQTGGNNGINASGGENGYKQKRQFNRYFTNPILPPKNLMGIPWRCAFALQADGWYLRSDVIWSKKNPMPESVTDRPTKAHEYLFLLAKSERYWFDQEAIREPNSENSHNGLTPNQHKQWSIDGASQKTTLGTQHQGRNKRTVWSHIDEIEEHNKLFAFTLARLASDHPELLGNILDEYGSSPDEKSDVWELATKPFPGAHFAVMPEALVELCLLAGCPAQVCAECGEPWVRVVERETKSSPNRWGDSPIRHLNSADAGQGQTNLEKSNLGMVTETKTIAHTPTCQCNGHFEEQMIPDYYDWEETAEAKKKVVRVYVPDISLSAHVTRPGVVLDPFFGSGTVGVVAKKFKREWAGIELNPDYAEMARQRLDQTQPALFAR